MGIIINVRGTNGSGKSTIVQAILAKARNKRQIYGVLGARQPEAYEVYLTLGGKSVPLYVLGPYRTAAGGADCIQPFDLIPELIRKYAARGDVLFEGVLVSKTNGQVGACLAEYGKDAILLFLDTTLEECIDSVQIRRDARGDARKFNPHNLTEAYKSVQRVRKTLIGEDKLRIIDVHRGKAVDLILELLLKKRK